MKRPNTPEARTIWDTMTNVKAFLDSSAWLKKNFDGDCLRFDKDNDQIMAFVAAAANLRMTNYSIPVQSLWDCKSMAGSIQPAIAATNAIVAGLQVDQMLRVLKAKQDFRDQPPTRSDLQERGIRFIWVRGTPTGQYLLVPEPLEPPNQDCFICQVKRVRVVFQNLKIWRVSDVLNRVLKEAMDCQGDIFLQSATTILYDPDLAEDDPSILDKNFGVEVPHNETVSVTASGPPCTIFDMVIQDLPDRFDAKLGDADFAFFLEKAAGEPQEDRVVDSKTFSREAPSSEVVTVEILEGDDDEVVDTGATSVEQTTKRKHTEATANASELSEDGTTADENPKKKRCTGH
eukprot:Protomagalhaensia_sp_Gyna_25__544@NODE_1255_length_2018_cov_8_819606_g999_i0_p1_GENE_NODE_1255_length_2018_cov_8_819606_g999_i0NODE_1255_length_2018_cov_8_819606_g999_i0_p1_ORF_typecomplete_len346_score85_32UBA_e1_thiolCys/PF10585_9/2_3e11ThiF/PF00899_21/0_00019_NODE_1255_length_2018_cov_8_819606_g999_i01641201